MLICNPPGYPKPRNCRRAPGESSVVPGCQALPRGAGIQGFLLNPETLIKLTPFLRKSARPEAGPSPHLKRVVQLPLLGHQDGSVSVINYSLLCLHHSHTLSTKACLLQCVMRCYTLGARNTNFPSISHHL